MAQKSNLLTIRKQNNIQLVTQNTKQWVSLFQFLNNITRLFFLKGILLQKYYVGVDTNTMSFDFDIYYQNSKMPLYKSKLTSKTSKTLLLYIKNESLMYLLKRYASKYFFNTYVFNLKNLNKLVDKKVVSFLFEKLESFATSIFARRYNLFIDFLKLTSLFFDQKIDLNSYIKLWSKIFKNISKRLHTKFIVFVNTVFLNLIDYSPKTKNQISGLKFIVAGRLRGKERSSTILLQLGRMPTQSLSKNVTFASCHSYTVYGSFGLKLWIYQKNETHEFNTVNA